jgi:hypothetical protein
VNGHQTLDAESLLSAPCALQPAGFFSRLGRIERHRQAKSHQQMVDAQLAHLKDQLATQVIIHREICRSTIQQVRVSLQETLQFVTTESLAARSRHQIDVLLTTAESIDAQFDRIQRITNPEVREPLKELLVAKLATVLQQLG